MHLTKADSRNPPQQMLKDNKKQNTEPTELQTLVRNPSHASLPLDDRLEWTC